MPTATGASASRASRAPRRPPPRSRLPARPGRRGSRASRRAGGRGQGADGRHRLSRAAAGRRRPSSSVGDPVRDGQTLLIIEAMKVMNQITAPRAGRVAQILVADGAPVEYGQAALVLD